MLFAAQCGNQLDANALTLRLQPNEGISLRFNGKVPGMSLGVRPVRMHFSYDSEFGAYTPEAYERLLLEAHVRRRHAVHPARRGGNRLAELWIPSALAGRTSR